MKIIAMAVALGLLGSGMAAEAQTPAAPLVMTKDLAANGTVVLDMNVGDLHVMRNGDEHQLRLEIQPHRSVDSATARSWVRRFQVAGDRADIALHLPKGDHRGADVTLYIPQKTALKLDLGIGDLAVKGIEGNKDLHVGIGDLTVALADAKDYGQVEGSTRIGDVNDQLYHGHQSGFLGKTEHVSELGQYHLRAHVGIGDVSLVPADGKL